MDINDNIEVTIDPYRTDQQLLRDIKEKEPNNQAWNKFYEKYKRFIYNIAIRYNVQAADRDAIVNGILGELWNSKDRFEYDPNGTFRGWLYTMVKNYILRQRRSKIVQNTTTFDPTNPIENGEDPGFEKIIEEEFEKFALEEALNTLQKMIDVKSYQIFHAVTLGGKKPSDVAKEFGINTDNVYLIKHKCVKILSGMGCNIDSKED